MNQVIQQLTDAKVFDAFVANTLKDGYYSPNVDNLSMLLAVATGKVFSFNDIYEITQVIAKQYN